MLIDVGAKVKEFGTEWCKVLLAMYVFTGEDCMSAFKGKGKVTPLKKLMKYPKFQAMTILQAHGVLSFKRKIVIKAELFDKSKF